jgi:hypothetical protein
MFDFSPVKILTAFLLLAVLSIWSWRFLKYSPFPKGARRAVFILRLLTVLFLLLLWFRFEYTFRQMRFEKPQVAVLIDNSESMRYHKTAPEAMIESLQKGPQLSFLRENAQIHWYAGHDEALSIPAGRLSSLAFDGNYTNLSALLSNVAKNHPTGTLDALILVSDGHSSVGLSPEDLGLKGIGRLIAIGLGDTLQAFLPGLILSQNKIFATDADTLDIRFTLENRNPRPLTGKISVMLTNQAEKVTLPVNLSPGRQEKFRARFAPRQAGNFLAEWQYTEAGADSAITLNTKVPVTIRPYLYKITIISEKPNPDAAFVRKILQSADHYQINNLLLSDFQDNPEKCDALLLFVSPGKAQELIATFAQGTPYAVFYQRETESIEWVERFNLEAYHPFLLTAGDLESTRSDWLNLPPAILSNPALPGKALVSAEKPLTGKVVSLSDDGGIYFGIQGIWRWNLAGFEKSWEKHYQRLILKSVDWLARLDQRKALQWKDDFVAISRYEKLTMPLICNLAEDSLRQNSRLVITVSDGDAGELWRQTISPPEEENLIEWQSDKAGKFHLAATLYSENARLATDSAEIDVGAISPEKESKVCDINTLRKLAENHNGFFVSFSNEDTLDYRPAQKQKELKWRFDAGSNVYFLIILLFPAIIEWIIRKRNGGI